MEEFKKTENTNKSKDPQWDRFFIAGPYSRIKEFFQVIKIAYEFICGFRAFHYVGPCISFFGSARTPEDHPYYQEAQKFAARTSQLGFTVMTGGGPGIMEAANRGAFEAGGTSIAANIHLPFEQASNQYHHKSMTFHYFFVRKTMLLKYSYAFIFFPGGFGTLDEAAEALTLISTKKLRHFPLIFIGKDYWNGFFNWAENSLLFHNMISKEELSYIHITDDIDEVERLLLEVKSKHKNDVHFSTLRKKNYLIH